MRGRLFLLLSRGLPTVPRRISAIVAPKSGGRHSGPWPVWEVHQQQGTGSCSLGGSLLARAVCVWGRSPAGHRRRPIWSISPRRFRHGTAPFFLACLCAFRHSILAKPFNNGAATIGEARMLRCLYKKRGPNPRPGFTTTTAFYTGDHWPVAVVFANPRIGWIYGHALLGRRTTRHWGQSEFVGQNQIFREDFDKERRAKDVQETGGQRIPREFGP